MSISRRKFLSWVSVAGLAIATGQKANAATTRYFKGYPDSLAVLHDSVLCLGCRKCEEACNVVNELPKPKLPFTDLSVLERNRRTTTAAHTVVNRYKCEDRGLGKTVHYYKEQCNHCLEPACASACFVGAFKKTKEGPVVYDPSVCVGCRYCMVACPFEIPTYEYDKPLSPRVMKCTMCYDRIIEGGLPGCVESCPAGALILGGRSELIKVARNRIEKRPRDYVDHIYGEHEMGGTSWLYLSGTAFDNIGLRTDLGNSAAGEFTAPALAGVPMVVGLWPVLLAGVYAITRRKETIADKEKARAIENAVDKVRNEAKIELASVIERAEADKASTVESEVKRALDERAEIDKLDSQFDENGDTK